MSVEMQGPVRPKVYDRRPTMKLRPEPTTAWGGSFPAAATMTSVYSWYMQPTYMPAPDKKRVLSLLTPSVTGRH